jgi:hypothetical protein
MRTCYNSTSTKPNTHTQKRKIPLQGTPFYAPVHYAMVHRLNAEGHYAEFLNAEILNLEWD